MCDKNLYTELVINTLKNLFKLNNYDYEIFKYFWVCPQKNSKYFLANDELIEFINKFLSSKTKKRANQKNIIKISKNCNLLIFLENNFDSFFWNKYKKVEGWSFFIKNYNVIDYIKKNFCGLLIPIGKEYKIFDYKKYLHSYIEKNN